MSTATPTTATEPATEAVATPAAAPAKAAPADPKTVIAPEAKEMEASPNATDAAPTLAKAQELFAQGTAALETPDKAAAAQLLSQALEMAAGVLAASDEQSVELVPFYVAYGKALLQLAKASGDVFGATAHSAFKEEEARRRMEEEQEEEEKEEAPAAQPETADPPAAEAKESAEATTAETSTASTTATITPENTMQAAPMDVDNEDEEEEGEEEQEEDKGDRELAWESFEVARVLLEQALESETADAPTKMTQTGQLAEVHALLGDLQIEEDQFGAAFADFRVAAALQQKVSGALFDGETGVNHREVAYCLFMAGAAASYDMEPEKARAAYADAASALACEMERLFAHLGIAVDGSIRALLEAKPAQEEEKEEKVEEPAEAPAADDPRLALVRSRVQAAQEYLAKPEDDGADDMAKARREALQQVSTHAAELLEKMEEPVAERQVTMEDLQRLLQGSTLPGDEEDEPEENVNVLNVRRKPATPQRVTPSTTTTVLGKRRTSEEPADPADAEAPVPPPEKRARVSPQKPKAQAAE